MLGKSMGVVKSPRGARWLLSREFYTHLRTTFPYQPERGGLASATTSYPFFFSRRLEAGSCAVCISHALTYISDPLEFIYAAMSFYCALITAAAPRKFTRNAFESTDRRRAISALRQVLHRIFPIKLSTHQFFSPSFKSDCILFRVINVSNEIKLI